MKNNKLKKGQLKIQAGKNQRFLVPESRKGQLKIQEMAFMIVGVILFFVLVGLFALAIIFNNLTQSANEISESRTLSAVSNIADSPEFNCGQEQTNCVDGDKAIALMNKKSYENFFPFSSLLIIRYSGLNKEEDRMILCTSVNYPECDVINIYDKNVKNERGISSYVAFCRKEIEEGYIYDKCEIAKMIAGTEIRIT